jgi:predicted  nucleic acid-binding Zn-ribbon protein
VKKSREEADRRAAEVQVKIDALMREAAKLEEALKGADAELADAKAKVPQDAVDLFVYVKSRVKHPPFIVPMEEMRCMGCHLKVSSDVWNLAKVAGNLTRCDGCGRIVYLER